MPTWTDTLDKMLLLNMYRMTGSPTISSEQWDTIAANLGEGCTGSSVYQRFRKQINKLGDTASGPTTPKSKGTGTPKSSKSTPASKAKPKSNKRKAAEEVSYENNEDDDEPKITPKRQRDTTVDAETPIKGDGELSEEEDLKTMFDIKTENEADMMPELL